MKKRIALLALASALASASALADITASTTARWDAKAVKDVKSKLTVTPLHSLVFQYGEEAKSFNTQDGAFDLVIDGQEGATDFKLTAKIINNTLTNPTGGTSPSTVDVGVSWYGEKLTKGQSLTLISASEGKTSGLEKLTDGDAYKQKIRTSDRASFIFSIDSGTESGKKDAITDLSKLPDGYWLGSVDVQFTAVWTTPGSDSGSDTGKRS